MIQEQTKYFDRLSSYLLEFFGKKNNLKIFIFGSSTKSNQFGDIDIGIMDDVSDQEIRQIKEFFEESNFPFSVDVINFNKVDESFRKNVFDNQVVWIKR